MKVIPRRVIEASLQDKGFQKDQRDHRFWYFIHKGKKTIIRTKISTGEKHVDYGTDLLKMMQRQLRLDRLKEAKDLLICPMDEDGYIKILLSKGLISS